MPSLLLLTLLTIAGVRYGIILASGTHIKSMERWVPLPQDTTKTDTSSTDSLQLRYPLKDRQTNFYHSEEEDNSFDLEDPGNIEKSVDYDPDREQYIIEEKVGEDYYRNPSYMSFEDYLEEEYKKNERDYWKKRSRASSLLEDESMIPELHVDNKVFDRIFGGSLIEIKPTGNVTLTFGGNYQKVDNPSFTEQQKRHGGFLFDMNINANVTGKIGDKMKVNFNYNTEAQFNFENEIKLDYSGKEDQIIQKIEAGNVSFPLQNSLITGSQSLFGIKTKLQFGRLTITSVFSQQESKTESIQIKGGAQTRDFEIPIDNYEANRHFFLAQYFRNRYNQALSDLPVINSNISIENIEVWITNTSGATENTRNIIAFMDMGETDPYSVNANGGRLPRNEANTIDSIMDDPNVKNANTAIQTLQSKYNLEPVQDFEKTYARKLSESEYSFHKQLGYISLNKTLNPDEVLAVAFEYTYNGKVYQVGQLAQDVPTGSKDENVVFLKMLKSTSVRTNLPIWDLMMKNVYSLNAYQVNQKNFRLDVYYEDPGGGVKRYIPEGAPKGIPLIQLLNLDNLNSQMEAHRDGVFDFVEGVTINSKKGKVIFPVVEPFAGDTTKGSGIRSAFNNPNIASKYTYHQLYDSTQVIARQFPEYNRYVIKGSYQSSVSQEISLNRMNIPKGSVKVTAGGQKLEEGVDYTVDYMLGKVKILNESILNSGKPINISFESTDLFGIQKKTMWGTRLDYWINDNFTLGGTVMHLSERPLTRKVNFGDEPIANTIWGLDGNYHTESQLITDLVDKIPLIDTKEKSSVTVTGEYANLIPGHSKAIEQNKEPTTYLDDFEGTRSFYDLKGPVTNWQLASTPRGATGPFGNILFPEADSLNDLKYNYRRANMAWYMMDPLFTRNIASTPDHVQNSPQIQRNHFVREVQETEVFPQKSVASGTPNVIPCLSLAYYPDERGPYNFNPDLKPDGSLKNPEENWAGIMQDLVTTDFEAANVEFIEFWVMDPFVYNDNADGGAMYVHLGNVSEDILKDGRKQFENGLPENNNVTNVDTTAWGRLPIGQPITNAFANDPEARQRQDVGFDGLNNKAEASFYKPFLDSIEDIVNPAVYDKIASDPSADDYHYYRGSDYDSAELHPLKRYKKYSKPEGNSPTSAASPENYSTSATNIPDAEDLNEDNTLSETEEYFQYRIKITPEDLKVGENFVTDKVRAAPFEDHPEDSVTWYQIKIPIRDYQKKVGNIPDFKSIRFMRVFLTDFDTSVIMRFARMGLVRHQWRKYEQPLLTPGEYQPSDFTQSTDFDVSVVNIEENSQRKPIPYVLPPGIQREEVVSQVSTQTVQQNEQSLSMTVCDLQDGDARAAYKNLNLDMRQFKRLKMYVHAEELPNGPQLQKGDVRAFIRIGSDFTTNYYEYEIPLDPTQKTNFNPSNITEEDREIIWPEQNYFDVNLDSLVDVKLLRNNRGVPLNKPFSITDAQGNRITVVGNPDMGQAKVMMIGLRNPKAEPGEGDDGLPKCAEVWFNELRLTEFDENGGSAALGRVKTKLADFGNVSLSGNMHTIGFGSIDKSINERQKDNFYQYDASGNFQLGKFFPQKWGVRVPMFMSITESFSNPQYDPYDTDVLFEDKLDFIRRNYQGEEQQKRIEEAKEEAQDYTRIKSLNFSNVRIAPPKPSKKSLPWDIRNFNMTYAYTETFERNPTMDTNLTKKYHGALGYNYSPSIRGWNPLRSVIKQKWAYLKFLRDFNLNPLPTSIGVQTQVDRKFSKTKLRSIGSETIPIDPTYDKQFDWNRTYNLNWKLTKSISLNYQASAISQIVEPPGPIDTEAEKDSVWKSVENFGRMDKYQHSVNASYNLPFNKFPITEWISANVSYNARYNWDAAPRTPRAQQMGNVIANAQGKQVNINLNTQRLYRNLDKLYNQIGGLFPKKEEEKEDKKGKKGEEEEGDKKGEEGKDKDKKKGNLIGTAIEKLITGVRNVTFSYRENRTTTVPGFTRTPSFMGADENYNAPGWDFLFGYQPGNNFWDRDFTPGRQWLDEAAANGWISDDTLLNKQFVQTYSQQFNGRASIEPFKGFRVDINFKRNFSRNYNEYFRDTVGGPVSKFTHLNPVESGSFNMSFQSWRTAFESTDSTGRGEAYYNFEKFRSVISERLAQLHAQQLAQIPDSALNVPGNYWEGYGPNSQQVLIPAFIAAYSGESPSEISITDLFPDIPKPNWRVSFNGLNKIAFIKKIFKNITISHAYTSTYSINRFTTSLDFKENNKGDPKTKNENTGNFYPRYTIQQVTISEQFSPLIEINVELHSGINTRVSYTKSRSMNLSLINYQLNKSNSSQFKVGVGYKFDHIDLPFSLGPIGGGELNKNSLNIKVDFSIRETENVIHKLDQNRSEPTGGNTSIAILPSADYKMSENLTAQLFFNYRRNIPVTSSSYPVTTIDGGIKLRYTLTP